MNWIPNDASDGTHSPHSLTPGGEPRSPPHRIRIPSPKGQNRIAEEVAAKISQIEAMRDTIETVNRRSANLRRAILDRAFRGEFVGQDSTDEPASVLLERIGAERATLASARRTSSRRRSTLPP